ncbi:hypothetical protein Dimus_005659 [Dionaea muscipula]
MKCHRLLTFCVTLSQEAQNKVAAFALYQLFPDLSFHLLILEPYASLFLLWEQGGSVTSVNKFEECQEVRRDDFVDSLLNLSPSELITSNVKDDSSNIEHQKTPSPRFAAPARVKSMLS